MRALLFLILPLLSFCQKKYTFDYALIFDETCKLHTKPNQMIYLVNSKINSILYYIHDRDSVNYTCHFTDRNGVISNNGIKKTDFFRAETISNDCHEVYRYTIKDKKDDYDFKNLKDTIINDTSYYHYELRCNKSLKYQKRKKLQVCNYIINKNQDSILPFLEHPTAYEKWKGYKNIPNGFPKMIYYSNLDGKITFTCKITNKVKIEKFFTIPTECDYSEKSK